MNIYIIVRRDLKMRRGKEIAQAAHAAIGLGVPDGPVITLQAKDLSDINLAMSEATKSRWKACVVRDAGRTEVPAGTVTCCAILAPKNSFSDFSLY